LLKFVVDLVFDALHEGIKDYVKDGETLGARISSQATRMVLLALNQMLRRYKSILKKQSFTQSVELAAIILAHYLADSNGSKRERFHEECESLIYNLLYKTLGIKTPNYKVLLRKDLARGRFTLLGRCLTCKDLDQKVKDEVTQELVNQLESLVLNDREPVQRAEKTLMYFQTFLAGADKSLVEEKLLP